MTSPYLDRPLRSEAEAKQDMARDTPGQDIDCLICGARIAWVKRPFPQLSDWQTCPLHKAAPDLLAALEELAERVRQEIAPTATARMLDESPALGKARAAIAKATE